MSAPHVDLFVIGAGSGGVRAARMAAAAGASVAVAEEARLGGTCVNVGCVPKKLMVYASHFRDEFEDASGFGWSTPPADFDWPTLIRNKDIEIQRLNDIYRRLLEGAGVEIVEGRASLESSARVAVGERRFHAERILVGTGGRPRRPAIPGSGLALVSDDVFALGELPERVVVIGGGYIALEFAGIFQGLGVQVTLVHRGDLPLRGFDDDLRTAIRDAMSERGVELRLGCEVAALHRCAAEVVATLGDGTALATDTALFAIGRDPNTRGIGLEAAGVDLESDGTIRVDEFSRTSVENIFAIGDCTNRMNLTPVAIAEAMALVDTLYRKRPRAMSYADIPTAVFSQPPLAAVGLTETQAREESARIEIYRSSFLPLKNTLSGRQERNLLKLVVDRETDRVLGAHMLGPDAAEIVQGLAIAIQCGATKTQFDATIGIHPTTAEEFVTMREPLPDGT
ncbi:MAG: glutathione-disulfide reductase [Acidobacteriota bacterium]|nr:glutathione-disulfide reductase [Acidobacteriota bacterium]